MKKIFKSVAVSLAIAVLPVIGNIKMFYYPQIWILFFIGIFASIFQPDYSLKINKSDNVDKGTEIQIIWSVFITQLLVVLEASYLKFPDSVKWDMFTTISLIVIILGVFIRTRAVFTLGKYFTMRIGIQDEHKIICNGPYKYFRHPGYAGAFLTYFCTSIFFHSWYSLIVASIVLPAAWIRRIHYEEKLLIDTFGEEYRDYCKTTKRIIPGIW